MSTNKDVIDFETTATQVEQLSAKVEEAMLSLSANELLEVGEDVGIRQGRLRTKSGKAKSKNVLRNEITAFVEKKCLGSAEDALQYFSQLHGKLKDRLLKSGEQLHKKQKNKKQRNGQPL